MVILNDSNAPSRIYYVPDIVFELSKTPKITFLLIGGPKISHNTYPHSLTHTTRLLSPQLWHARGSQQTLSTLPCTWLRTDTAIGSGGARRHPKTPKESRTRPPGMSKAATQAHTAKCTDRRHARANCGAQTRAAASPPREKLAHAASGRAPPSLNPNCATSSSPVHL